MRFFSACASAMRGVFPSLFRARPATQIACRTNKSDAALVFLHGFGGDAAGTWGDFPTLICSYEKVQRWDVHSLGYPTTLRIDVPGIWTADPELRTVALELRTTLSLPPFSSYKVLAITAHSMGGLVVQRAILDDDLLANRISHVILFGTPSAGLTKASAVGRLKRQFRDMAADGPFIQDLRKRWDEKYRNGCRFQLRVIAGDRDEFVPSVSSLDPFPLCSQAVIPGNHIEIVKPSGIDDRSVLLVIDALSGDRGGLGFVDSARLAVERKHFQEAVDALLPNASHLDDSALVTLALALEGLGKGAQALSILEARYRGGLNSPDAMGVLAGRLKRRWLAERHAADLARARELYCAALEQAETTNNHEQAYYHAINVAFLDIVAAPVEMAVPHSVRDLALRCLEHCKKAPMSRWRAATEAEIELISGQLDNAIRLYIDAVSMMESPRQVYSMYSQAIRVASRLYGERGVHAIDAAFAVNHERPGSDRRKSLSTA